MSVNRFLFRCQLQFKTDAARTRPVVVADKTYAGGVAEDTDVDIQPITRADFVPAKVFRSRSMNTRAALQKPRCGATVCVQRKPLLVHFDVRKSASKVLLYMKDLQM